MSFCRGIQRHFVSLQIGTHVNSKMSRFPIKQKFWVVTYSANYLSNWIHGAWDQTFSAEPVQIPAKYSLEQPQVLSLLKTKLFQSTVSELLLCELPYPRLRVLTSVKGLAHLQGQRGAMCAVKVLSVLVPADWWWCFGKRQLELIKVCS